MKSLLFPAHGLFASLVCLAAGGALEPRDSGAVPLGLPAEVLAQKKAGFGAPADHWLAHDLREMVDDLLAVDRLRSRGLFRPGAVQQMVQRHRSGRRDWSFQIWQLLTLELWFQQFMDR